MTRKLFALMLALLLALAAFGALAEEELTAPAAELTVPEEEIDLGGAENEEPGYADFVGEAGVSAAAADGSVAINKKNFPDEVFRESVVKRFDRDKDGALSPAEIAAVKTIKLSIYNSELDWIQVLEVKDFTGVRLFKNLSVITWDMDKSDMYDTSDSDFHSTMDLSGCKKLRKLKVPKYVSRLILSGCSSLKTLDLSYCRALKTLDLSYCRALKKLDASGCSSLKTLDLSNCRALNNLDVSGCSSLKTLNLNYYYQALEKLNISGCTALTTLNCYGCEKLKALDASTNKKLKTLDCSSCALKTLKLPKGGKLTELYCGNNKLKTLKLPKGGKLTSLICSNNQLKALDVSRVKALKYLDCSRNRLKALDVSRVKALKYLDCSRNRLKTLDVSGHRRLELLACSGNRLTSLYLTDCPKLEGLLAYGEKQAIGSIDLAGCDTLIGTVTRLEAELVTEDSPHPYLEDWLGAVRFWDDNANDAAAIHRATRLTVGSKVLYAGNL